MGDLRSIKLSDVQENPVALRAVNRNSEQYAGLVQSMKVKGFFGAITVRERFDVNGVAHYELIDGLHRYNAAKDAGLDTIQADVVKLEDADVLEAQILANVHKVETRPVEYSHQLRRILAANPMMTESELAFKIGKSPAWIKERLGLTKITNAQIVDLINGGKISLSNAYAIAKLPDEEQVDFIDRGITMKPDEFTSQVTNRLNEIRQAKRSGEAPADEVFAPSVHVQRLKVLKDEMDAPNMGRTLLAELGISDPLDAWQMAIKWALNMDPKSVAAQKAKDEERKAAREAAKAEKQAAREAAKAAKAAEAAAEATA